MLPPLRPDLAAPLAELALRELTQAGFGGVDATGRSEATIVAEALGLPAALLAFQDDRQRLHVAVQSRPDGTPEAFPTGSLPEAGFPVEGALAEALERSSCVELSDVPGALAEAGVGGGLVVRIGSDQRPYALLGVFTPAPLTLPADARPFLCAAASALHARFALDHTRRALEESRARALALFETTVDGVVTICVRGRIESFNAGAIRIFGYTAEEVLGKNVSVLMPEPYHTEHDGYMDAYARTGTRRIIGIGREVVGRRKSGATFPMDLAVSEVALPGGGRIYTGLIRDLSERRRLEREVVAQAEAERRRIGQDLHDGLGQQLTAIGLFLRGLARGLAADGSPRAATAEQLVGLVGEADDLARGLARSLVPVELERNGLEAALVGMAARTSALYGVSVTSESTGSGAADAAALRPDSATNLFWIAQEAVSNAIQHGNARHVQVILVRGTDRLRLRIEDDGRGIDDALAHAPPMRDGRQAAPDAAETAPPLRGLGLRIMHHRAHLAGGTLEVRPGAGGGTVVTCAIPLRGPGFNAS